MKKILVLFLLGFSISTYSQSSGEKLFKAIFDHNLDAVKKIVEKDKSQVNYVRKMNESFYIPVLMQAVMNNEVEISKFLIENGADINKTDGFKMTCLM
jgi:ankyrin repeat protein